MKKRLLSLVMSAALLFGSAAALPEGVFETSSSITASAETSGDFEYNILDDGTVEITKYNGSGGNVTIPSSIVGKKVTSIGEQAFNSCKNLTSITIPNSVTSIGSCAFYNCTSLTSVTIPNSVTSIGGGAFGQCSSLTSVTIPDSVISIGDRLFRDCYNLSTVELSKNLKELPNESFYECSSLTKITIPGSIKNIGKYAFTLCDNLNTVIINEGVETIGLECFLYDKNLSNISIPKSIKWVDAFAFTDTKWLELKRQESPLVIINDILVDGVTYNNTSLRIPDSVKSISPYALCPHMEHTDESYQAKNIQDIQFSSSVEYIGRFALSRTIWGNIKGVYYRPDNNQSSARDIIINKTLYQGGYSNQPKSYTIPNNIKVVSELAICSNVDVLTIPKNVEKICDYAYGYLAHPGIRKSGIKLPPYKDTSKQYKIRCYKNTAGEKYAIDNGFDYEIINEDPVSIADCTINLSSSSYTYDGNAKTPSVTVKYGSKALVKGTDYTVAYKNNVNVGTATVTVTGKGDYTGSVSKTFKITAANISGATISGVNYSYTYTGKAITPAVTVALNGKSLAKDTDYTVSYKSNINVGTATITVTGKGNYTGSVSKTFAIVAAKTSISNATISGVNSSYTYTGKAITPAVTVKLNSKTLTNSTDYSVAYKDNINVGTATVTVTGKGNYTGSVSKTFTIVAETTPSSSFVWGKDNWNYNNSSYSGYFSSGTYRSQINNTYLNKLKNNLTNSEYQVIFVGTYYSDAWLDDSWGGSCYGMSSTTFLAQKGLLPYSSYGSGATKLHDLTWPTKSSNISSLVTYYQMLQVKDVIQQQYRTIPSRSNSTNINSIINLLKSNPTVLIGFQKSGWGGHAILAYGYEYGSWTYGGITYQGRIKICDPNSSIKNDESYYIYYNTSTYSWAIPAYSGITSAKGATFNYIGANVNEINQGGYLSGNSSTRSTEYIARIDAAAISNNRSVAKVKNTNGNYVNQNTAPGDIVESYSYVVGGNEKETVGYDLYDADAAYMVSQAEAVNMQLSIKYQDCRLYGGSAAGNSVIFDKNGFVSVNGESARFNISMTHDIDLPTDWFTVQVKGDNANDASLKKVNNGWVVSADRLENVEVAVNNKDDSAKAKFSTKYKSALIYEINKNTIGIAVDTDNNGTYETNVKTEDLTQTRLAGKGRYETAVEISKAGFPDGAKTVVLAYGLNYADALAGVPLATKLNAPILLTAQKSLPAETLAEIKRLKAKNVIILGGTGAIDTSVETALKREGLTTERIAGKTRFETATKIAERLQKLNGNKPTEMFFVYAFNFADALSVSAVAAAKNAPIIYLQTKGNLDDATKKYLESIRGSVKKAYVIGGTGVISIDMMNKAATALGLKSATRVAGKDRFATCVAVNNEFKTTLMGKTICVATGMDFPDALAGGVFAALNKAPLFLINGKAKSLTLSDSQKSYLKTKSPQKLYVFGGKGAVPDSHVQAVAAASV